MKKQKEKKRNNSIREREVGSFAAAQEGKLKHDTNRRTITAAAATSPEVGAELRGKEADPSLLWPIFGVGAAASAVDPCITFGILRY